MESLIPSLSQDQILWKQFKNGDQQAFTKIYRDYYPRLLNYGLKIKPNEEFVKDCIQEIFYDLLQYINKLGNTDNILFYLIASLRRKIFRKLKYDFSFRIDENPYTTLELPEDSSEDKVVDKEWGLIRKRKLKTLIDALPPRQKEAMLMRFFLDLDYEEISDVMEVNVQSVRNLVHKAIKILRERITEDFY
ncbi:MAG: RNA polymerase sigma factor [Bacteroidota bacterium]